MTTETTTLSLPNCTPQQAAEHFCQEYLCRQLDTKTFRGEWKGTAFSGSFKVYDGVRHYNISWKPKSNWEISYTTC